MADQQAKAQDPRQQEPQPPFPKQEQQPPGLSTEMEPRPDYGEQSYQGHGRLKNKVAIITGADSGIGRAVALTFAREGADVLVSYLSEDVDAQETKRLAEESGRKAVLVPGDIGNESHAQSLIERAMQEWGKLDILVNNAAFQRTHQSIQEVPTEEWQRTFRTNIDAMFYLSKAALPKMQKGGVIINTSSIQAYQPSASLLAYATTKGAIVTFTKALSHEAIKHGIRVNAVAPGPVWTPLIPATMPPEQVAKFGKQSPMGRPAQPIELAPAYVFLASDEASYVNGEVIGVTGGEFLP